MPTLDWLNREDAFRLAARVPTRVLRAHAHAPAIVSDGAAAKDKFDHYDDNLEHSAWLKMMLPQLLLLSEFERGGPGVAQQIDATTTGAV
jgi:hypothetical protein